MVENGSPSLVTTDRFIAEAERQFSRYIFKGPALPLGSLNMSAMEEARGCLGRSPYAEHHQAAGWLAVEQAFVLARNPRPRSAYSLDRLFEAAQTSFAMVYDRYDDAFDLPTLPLQAKLAAVSLARYISWATNEPMDGKTITQFHEETTAVGRELLSLNDQPPKSSLPFPYIQRNMNGLAAELVVLGAFNRRHINGGAATALALPSTIRQNKSVRPGTVGSMNDTSKLRGNWDVSVIGWDGGWGLAEKLQIKSILQLSYLKRKQRGTQLYSDDITVVGVKENMLATLPDVDVWRALRILTQTDTSGSPSQRKHIAVTMSRELYAHIERKRQERVTANSPAP